MQRIKQNLNKKVKIKAKDQNVSKQMIENKKQMFVPLKMLMSSQKFSP